MRGSRVRIGVLLAPLGKFDTPALRYAILQLNALQAQFEFDLLYESPFSKEFTALLFQPIISRASLEERLSKEMSDLAPRLLEAGKVYDLESAPRHSILVVTQARFDDDYYSTGFRAEPDAIVLALGNWNSQMAPPSMLEFIVGYCVREAVVVASGHDLSHYDSAGCMFDFNHVIQNARYHLLTGHICDACRETISRSKPAFLSDLDKVLGGRWLGDPSNAYSAHQTLARLGFKAFRTSGTKPTFREMLWEALRSKGVEGGLDLVFKVAVTALLLWLGLEKL